MEVGHLRSSSLSFTSMEGKGENLSRIKSLHRQVSNTLKRRKQAQEVTKNCTKEFDFVSFDTISESQTRTVDEVEKNKCLMEDNSIDRKLTNNSETQSGKVDEEEKNKSLIKDKSIDWKLTNVAKKDGNSIPEKKDEYSDTIDRKEASKKGILWQQTDKIFSTWQERFFVLTENSLYSFSRETNKINDLKKAVSKVISICLVNNELMNESISD